jgi:anti-sigma factor RsiW
MNCELAHESIVAAAYGELSDEQTHELERHLIGCADCAAQRAQLHALKVLAGALPVVEPEPNLLARSRMRLDEALDALPPLHWYERLSQRMIRNFASLQAAPVAAILLLIAGAGAGGLGTYEIAQGRTARAATAVQTAAAPQTAPSQPALAQPASALPDIAHVASISSIVRKPNSQIVDVSYNQLVPQHVEGSLDNPAIRQLLMMASEDSASPGLRDNSVGLLADECRAGHSCRPNGIRDTLLVALRRDRDARVRQTALEGLEPYVAQDMRVRDAVLQALLYDDDPQVRTAAINILVPVEGDTSVRQVLHSIANTDQNPYIRTVSTQILSHEPEIQ